ncbi:enoyl-CoA hydratase [Sphaerisporangium krabiense]|uniref:2-(1,2-epoxy-1,2-dihydrophenyl)acetyl-CoA isomerase n=1 Tax=Sphaerisporangium krabiense TaxID=763782 RepID=A0A7W8Z4X1_9ACTN|nr:enoyl-CoA hydratase-related protein [Sphaerisporangium krabiense]MBB5627522.1 2-(1,2-epoxy-1,2-dihydrophenyl)acetyl-CoA isomerase [Sphaerisporangium krabiense]GII66537.1 enoyl-CoA hydratase [Sphaerisporangium krabiense]
MDQPATASPTADEHGHDHVLYSVEDSVATVTLNRPEAMNALTVQMKASLLEALERARDDAGARAVLLTGAGRAFCAGQDLQEHAANLEAGVGLDGTVRAHYNPIVLTVTGMGKPVVAAVNGVAAGAGASLAFACDFRVAAENAKFAMAFGAIGLVPDSGASWTLPRLVGPAKARELLLLGDTVGAEEALRLGLATAVVPAAELGARARELAVRLAQGPTLAYGAIKQALDYSAAHTLEDSLEVEADLQDFCAKTEDHERATRAFLAKQKPVFQGR